MCLFVAGCQCGPPPPPGCWIGSCGVGYFCDLTAHYCRPCPSDSWECADSEDAGPIVDAGPISCDEHGAACTRSCASGTCQSEPPVANLPTVRRDGSAGRGLPMAALPGGMCTEACDATRLNDDCGPCSTCSGDMLLGRLRVPLGYAFGEVDPSFGVCRTDCTPSPSGGGCRPGYVCDSETSTCMEACSDDVQCQVSLEDLDGDGYSDVVDRGADSGGYCDTSTGRCRNRGRAGAAIGDPCEEDADCPDDGACLRGDRFPDGYCTRLGCRGGAVECDAGTACDWRNLGRETSGCAPTCRIGAEDGTPSMLGATGGNPDCAAGFACFWNGSSPSGADAVGSCLPGVYNDRTTPEIGAACTEDAQCHSPFGYGLCLYRTLSGGVSGMCSVQSCGTFLGAEGDPVDGLIGNVEIGTPICDSAHGEICMSFNRPTEPPLTYCLTRCDDASQCAPGHACVELLAASRFCFPLCYTDGDCRSGATCQSEGGGDCTEASYCHCSERP